MTDERIKEVLKKWMDSSIIFSEDEERFAEICKSIEDSVPRCACFYAGFRAAERLAKIEVLSDLLVTIEKLDEYPVDEHTVGKNDGYSRVIDIINELLSSIKE